MSIPVLAAGRGSSSVLDGQAEAKEPPETMIGLHKGHGSPESPVSSDVDWVGFSDPGESTAPLGSNDSRGKKGVERVHRRLRSDVVLVSARVGRGFSWSDCERLFGQLRGDGRLLLAIVAGPYSGEEQVAARTRRNLRETSDFFLPVNTPGLNAALERTSSREEHGEVPEYLAGVVKLLRARLRRSDTLTKGLQDLLDMTQREKITLLKVGLAAL